MMSAQKATIADRNSWGFMFDPLPKKVYKRMKNTKLTANAILVYMFLLERLDGKSKDGWTMGITDEQIAAEVGISCHKARVCRRELVNHDFFEQEPFRFYGNKVKGMWKFKIKRTVPANKKAVKKFSNTARVPEAKPVETPTQKCSESVQENVANPYTFSENENAAKPDEHKAKPTKRGVSHKDIKEDISNTLSPKPSLKEEKKVDRTEDEREGLGNIFSEKVFKRPTRNKAALHKMNTYFQARITDIANDARVTSTDQAREILIDSFDVVRKLVTPIYSHTIFDAEYGERAIETAIGRVNRSAENDRSDEDEPVSEDSPCQPETDVPTVKTERERVLAALWHCKGVSLDRIVSAARRRSPDRLAGVSDETVLTIWHERLGQPKTGRNRLDDVSASATIDKAAVSLGDLL